MQIVNTISVSNKALILDLEDYDKEVDLACNIKIWLQNSWKDLYFPN